MVRHGASAAAIPGEPFPLIGDHSDPPLAPEGQRAALRVRRGGGPAPRRARGVSAAGGARRPTPGWGTNHPPGRFDRTPGHLSRRTAPRKAAGSFRDRARHALRPASRHLPAPAPAARRRAGVRDDGGPVLGSAVLPRGRGVARSGRRSEPRDAHVDPRRRRRRRARARAPRDGHVHRHRGLEHAGRAARRPSLAGPLQPAQRARAPPRRASSRGRGQGPGRRLHGRVRRSGRGRGVRRRGPARPRRRA